MTFTPDAAAVIAAAFIAGLIAVAIPMGTLLLQAGRLQKAVEKLEDSIKAIHLRFDGFKTEFRDTASHLRSQIETGQNTLGAEVLEIREQLLAANLITPIGPNGRPR